MSALDERAGVITGVRHVAQCQSSQPILVRHVTALYREHVKIKHKSEQSRYNALSTEIRQPIR